MSVLESLGYSGWVLHFLIFFPLIGMLAVLLVGARLAKHLALAITAVEFLVSVPLWFAFNPASAAMQFGAVLPWVPQWGIYYRVGLDGISLLLVLLTTFLMPLAVLGSYRYITRHEKSFYAMLLLLEMGVVGVFSALDLFLFFMFWEIVLVPMYFIIGIWGGQRRIYAAIKFFLYTTVGSLLMLVGILYLFFKYRALTGGASFAYADLLQVPLTFTEQYWLFGAFALAFAIKVPLFPFHTWLPDAHVEAPTPGSVILASIMLKMGTFGFLRFALPLFPGVAMDPTVRMVILVLAVIAIIYGALVALVQPDFKKLVACSSVSHLGFVMLGIFALTVQSVQGALMVMINHGLSTGALFFLIGMIYERRHTRLIESYGGIARVVPLFAALLTLVSLSSIGLPGTNGFIGEFLMLVGAYRTTPVLTVIATTAVIIAAAYLLWAIQRILFNSLDKPENVHLTDLNRREMILMAPLVAGIIWMGVYPAPVLRRMEVSAERFVRLVETKSAVRTASGER